jgi:hypothetical protein
LPFDKTINDSLFIINFELIFLFLSSKTFIFYKVLSPLMSRFKDLCSGSDSD